MPNPTIDPQTHLTQTAARTCWTEDNGYLSVVPGYLIAGGSKGLPPAGEQAESLRLVEVDVPERGHMRITYEARNFRHHRSSHWSWHAVWADRLDAGDTPLPPPRSE